MEGDPGVDQSEDLNSACNGGGEPQEELPLTAMAHVDLSKDQKLCNDMLPSNHNGNVKGDMIGASDEQVGVGKEILSVSNDRVVNGNMCVVKQCERIVKLEALPVVQFFCDTCFVTCTSAKDFETHVSGRRHAKATQAATSDSQNLTVKEMELKGLSSATSTRQGSLAEGLTIHLHEKDTLCGDGVPHNNAVGVPTLAHFSGMGRNSGLHDSSSMDGSLKGNDIKLSSEGLSMENVIMSLITKGHFDCVARAMARACYCPGLGLQALGCRESRVMGGIIGMHSTDMVEMHSHCLINLLHEVRFHATKDLLWHALTKKESIGLETRNWGGSLATVPASAPSQAEKENMIGTMGRAQDAGKEDLLTSTEGMPLVGKSPLTCPACNTFCNSEKDFVKHCEGKKHAARLRLLQSKGKRCREDEEEDLPLSMEVSDDGCSAGVTVPDSRDGEGKEDMVTAKASENREGDAIKLSVKRRKCEPSSVNQVNTQFYCGICFVACTSAKDFETHVSGRKHAKAKRSATSDSGLGSGISSDKEALMLQIEVPSSTGRGDLVDGVNMHAGQVNVSEYINIPATGQGSLEQGESLTFTGQGSLEETKGVSSTGQGNLVNGVNKHVGQGNVVEIQGLSSSGQGNVVDINGPSLTGNLVNIGVSLTGQGNLVEMNVVSSAEQWNLVDINGVSLMGQGIVMENNGRSSTGQGNLVEINGILGDGISTHSGQAHKEDTLGTSGASFAGQPVEVPASSVECLDLNEAPADVPPTPLMKSLDVKNELTTCASNVSRSYVVPTAVVNGSAMVAALVEGNSKYESLSSLGSLTTTLISKAGCDCVARAMMARHGCPVLGGQAASGHSESQAVGCSHGTVKVHAVCFLNLLHEIWIATTKDLLLHALSREETPKYGLAGSEKGLEHDSVEKKCLASVQPPWICGVCNLKCNSQNGLQSHYNGKKHASKVRMVQSKGNST